MTLPPSGATAGALGGRDEGSPDDLAGDVHTGPGAETLPDGVWRRLRSTPAVERIRRGLDRHESAHAWLLLGPPGSGKSSVAMAMAAALNCEIAPGTGCGECSTCLRILRRRHPDVHLVSPEGPLIPVDVIREAVVPEAARSPFEGRQKVFVIEDADKMNEPAQNALLKTLEEPQSDTTFLLISDHEEELLETIRSRCRTVRLESVPEGSIVELLTAEGVPEDSALLAARLSDGDIDRARSLALDDGARERRDQWIGIPRRLNSAVDALDAAAEILTVARQAVAERAVAQKSEVVELAESMGEGRGTATARSALAKRHKRELRRLEEDVLGEALQSLASFYRDVLVVRSSGTDAVANLDLMKELSLWAAAADISDSSLLAATERCITARSSLTHNANQTLAIESTLLDIAGLIPASERVGVEW
jgi:DNA polymerase-3 subunit delta'